MACIPCGSLLECFILEGFRGVLLLNVDDLSWLLVATKPRSEYVARQHLERQGFEVCLPEIRVRKRKQGSWQQVTEPMFPGYIFVGVVLGEQDIAAIRSTAGCVQVVRFGGHLVPVPASVMYTLLSYAQEPLNETKNFFVGERLRVESGPFEGLDAVFDKPRGQDRVQVLVAIMGGVRPIQVAATAVGPY